MKYSDMERVDRIKTYTSKDELAVMDGDKCILQLRGVRPFFSRKYDITSHKRYKELSDYNPKYAFDIERYVRHRAKLKKDEEVEVTEVIVDENDAN